ncbi:MAG TPA: protein kinase, partial [Planctomycetota bacterium]|nr:protein kinase [Planctomycetota bacterium]
VHSIGRDPKCDLVLPESFLTSKRHAEIELRSGRLLVSGVGVGGIGLNGKRITAQTTASPGDQIQVGSSFILVQVEDEAEGAASGPIPAPGGAPAAELPRVDGYELTGEIAGAAAWKLYQGREKKTGQVVAVKVLDREQAKNPTVVERFSREGRALQKLEHPNIVRIYDVGESNGLHFYVTEHVPGGRPLSKRLKDGPLGARLALQVGIQIANALELAHSVEVFHRDVSPSSILITPGGVAKLYNFACVKLSADQAHTVTTLGDVVGDIVYSSPEQVADPRKADPRSDLYSLGATLFHAIAGRPPFVGKNYIEQVRLTMTGTAPSLGEFAPGASPTLVETIAKLLSPKPEARYQTAPEAAAALKEALLESAVSVEQAEASWSAKRKPAAAGELAGAFSGTELLDILQFLELGRKKGTLEVAAPPVRGELDLRDGEIVGARSGATQGATAVAELLATSAGTFRFSPGDVAGGDLKMKPSMAALEALKLRDA